MGLIISRALAHLWDEYDYAFLDNTPVLGVLLINALAQSAYPDSCTDRIPGIEGPERMLLPWIWSPKVKRHGLSYTIIPTMFDRRNTGLGSRVFVR